MHNINKNILKKVDKFLKRLIKFSKKFIIYEKCNINVTESKTIAAVKTHTFTGHFILTLNL